MSSVIITDSGFSGDNWQGGWATPDDPHSAGKGLMLANTVAAADLLARFASTPLMRIEFPHFTDGRGFSLASQLRLSGYTGRLRAAGYLIPDQYAQLRRCGFDEVEIDQGLALRHPVEDWKFRANWRGPTYQARLQQTG